MISVTVIIENETSVINASQDLVCDVITEQFATTVKDNNLILEVQLNNEQLPPSGASVYSYSTTGNDTNELLIPALANKSILLLFTNGVSRTGSDFTYGYIQGKFTFASVIDSDTSVIILYK